MRTQERRVNDLEMKAGIGTNTFDTVISEIFVPSPDGPLATGEIYGSRIGHAGMFRNHPGETMGAFKARLMKIEPKP